MYVGKYVRIMIVHEGLVKKLFLRFGLFYFIS